MGNWRTVWIVGTCKAEDVPALKTVINYVYDYRSDTADGGEFGPLSDSGSLAGIGNWAATAISAIGNLAERDYTLEQVVEHLDEIASFASSLNVKIHCGGDWEDKKCIATIIKEPNAPAIINEAEIEEIPEISKDQMVGRFMKIFARQHE